MAVPHKRNAILLPLNGCTVHHNRNAVLLPLNGCTVPHNRNAILLPFANHLKTHRCYLLFYSNTGPSILPTLMQPGRHRINTFPYEVNRKGGICISNLFASSSRVLACYQLHTQIGNGVSLRHRGGHAVGRPRANQLS
jgi:hypothetical protein